MASADDYQVRLSGFQGPLDLLLYLIRRAEVDIHDIPIHEITQQYFTYLAQIDRIDIDLAGEFLVMAATLIEIKSRTPTPRPVDEDDSGAASGAETGAEHSDPRFELVRQLLEYQRFRTAADDLERLRREFAERWSARAAASELDTPADEAEQAIDIEDAHILDLFETYERIIGAIDLSRLGDHRVEYDDTPITLHQADLVDRLQRSPQRSFSLRAAFEGRSRGEMIGLFLATLELARQGRIRIRQDDPAGEIELELVDDEAAPAANEQERSDQEAAAPQ